MLHLEFNNTSNSRVGGQSTLETGLASEAGAMMMMSRGNKADGPEQVNADDMFEEFLQDEDNANLEVICSKWRGLDGFDVDNFSKVCPEIPKDLLEADKHVQEFLAYRRSLNEKHARKEAIKKETERKMRAVDAALGTRDQSGRRNAFGDDGELSEPSSPDSYGSPRKSTVRHSRASDDSPRFPQTKPSSDIGDGAQGTLPRLSQITKGQPSRKSRVGNSNTSIYGLVGPDGDGRSPSRLSQAGSVISGIPTQAGPDTDRQQQSARGSQAGSAITGASFQVGRDAEKHHHVPGHPQKSSLLKSLGMADQNGQGQQALLLYEKKLEKSQRNQR